MKNNKCLETVAYGANWRKKNFVNIGSANYLAPDRDNPWTEPMPNC